MAAAFKRGVEPKLQDFVGETEGDDSATHGEHVRVVVLTRESRREQVVAQRGAYSVDLVRGELLALSAAAEDDAHIGIAVANGSRHGGADRRVVGGRGAVRAVVEDLQAGALQNLDEVLLEQVAGVVGTDRDA